MRRTSAVTFIWAFFLFGICFTNHQTLIVAAMGIEVAIAAADFKMGRSLFLGNSIVYICGLILKQERMIFTLTPTRRCSSSSTWSALVSVVAYCLVCYR